jgi:hypothetical protein
MTMVLDVCKAVSFASVLRCFKNFEKGYKMSNAFRILYLRIALIVTGLAFIFGIYPLSIVWPSGWAWGQGHSHYLMMIIGVYAIATSSRGKLSGCGRPNGRDARTI